MAKRRERDREKERERDIMSIVLLKLWPSPVDEGTNKTKEDIYIYRDINTYTNLDYIWVEVADAVKDDCGKMI